MWMIGARIPRTSVISYMLWKDRQAPRFFRGDYNIDIFVYIQHRSQNIIKAIHKKISDFQFLPLTQKQRNKNNITCVVQLFPLVPYTTSYHDYLSYGISLIHHYLDKQLIIVPYTMQTAFNTLRPRQYGRHFTDDVFNYIFLNENVWIPIENALTFVPKVSINNNPALFQIMAWRRPGDEPLSEPMVVRLPTQICVNRPQWVNTAKTVETSFLPTKNHNKMRSYNSCPCTYQSKCNLVFIFILLVWCFRVNTTILN